MYTWHMRPRMFETQDSAASLFSTPVPWPLSTYNLHRGVLLQHSVCVGATLDLATRARKTSFEVCSDTHHRVSNATGLAPKTNTFFVH